MIFIEPGFGHKMEPLSRMRTLGNRHITYIKDLILYMPVLAIIHLWMVFSPHSESLIANLVSFFIRYGGSLLLLDALSLTRRVIGGFYVLAIPFIVFGYVITSRQQSALNFAPVNSTFLFASLVIFSNIFLLIVLTDASPAFIWISWLQTAAIFVMMMPLYFFKSGEYAEFAFWSFIIIFILISLCSDIPTAYQLIHNMDHNDHMILQYTASITEDRPIKFPFCHIAPVFCFSYYMFAFMSELKSGMTLQAIFSMSTLMQIIVKWCTSFTVLIAIESILVLIGHNIIMLLRYCLINGRENRQRFRQLFNPGRANHMLYLFILCPIFAEYMIESHDKKGLILSAVLHFTFTEFINDVWFMLRSLISHISGNSAERRLRVYIEVFICVVIITVVSILMSLSVAIQFELSIWSAMCTLQSLKLVFDAVMTFVEYTVDMILSCCDINAIKTQTILYFISVSKCIGILFCFVLEGYNGALFPKFPTDSISVMIISGTYLFIMWKVAVPFVLIECIQHLRKTRSRAFVNTLPTATLEQISKLNDVCAICSDEMKDGVVTPCKHIFHLDCLQKASSVRQSCPKCNKLIFTYGKAYKFLVDLLRDLHLMDNLTRHVLDLV
ncbi:hypothetical protein ACJMK2_018520 [Sinanodonta woodiana]|uniref:RING-type domain-containing protein n=1 Tax=Sinanodonta woodiana TaxID=1069815 RepID=A0ABD3UF74_SINWO